MPSGRSGHLDFVTTINLVVLFEREWQVRVVLKFLSHSSSDADGKFNKELYYITWVGGQNCLEFCWTAHFRWISV